MAGAASVDDAFQISKAVATPLLVVALVAFVAVGAGLAAGCGWGGSDGETTVLSPGESAQMQNGLTFVAPADASATITRMPEDSEVVESALIVPGRYERDLADSLLEDGVSLFSTTLPGLDGSEVFEGEPLLARSDDDAVLVFWRTYDDSVTIQTYLAGQVHGEIELPAPEATNRREAWQEAQRVWEWLSIEGAALPRFGEGVDR